MGDKDWFLNGLDSTGRLFGIVEMCRDDSGYVDPDDAWALASSVGGNVDFALLDSIIYDNNSELHSTDDGWGFSDD